MRKDFLLIGVLCGLAGFSATYAMLRAESPEPRRVIEQRAVEFTDAEVAMYKGMLASIGTADIEAAEHISESDIVELTAAALQGLMESSFQGWRAGFEDYLRTVLEMTDEQIVLAVYGVYANRAVLLANATLAELGL